MRGIYVLSFWLCINLTTAAQAQWSDGTRYADSDLSAGASIGLRDVGKNLTADRMDSYPNDTGDTVVEIVRVRGEQVLPVDGLPVNLSTNGHFLGATYTWYGGLFSANCESGQFLHGEVSLETEKYSIKGSNGTYVVGFDVPCGMSTRLSFASDSAGGQALGIWHIAYTAMFKLNQAVGLDFWRRSITIRWPEDADYYNRSSVHITRGDHWDVVGHELGHAIYDQANMGGSTGGEHYIDRCYSGTMALSEGWASYFSAWLSIDLADNDAKFEFMVPRRAPIRLEHVPEDVCAGTGSEWRLSSFLWDIIDHNVDGEDSTATFAQVWTALAGKRSRDPETVRRHLLDAGFDQATVDTVWLLNFGSEAAPFSQQSTAEIGF